VERALLLIFVVGVVAVGAGCVHNAFTPSTTMRFAPRPDGCYVDLIFLGEPPGPYVVIGRVSTESTAQGLFAIGENNEAAMERLKEEACRAGAHGLLQADTQAEGSWTKNGYSKSTTGAAVAFVYVDPYGRPLPPPRGPRVVIHPGAQPVAPIARPTPAPIVPPPPPPFPEPPPPAAMAAPSAPPAAAAAPSAQPSTP